MAPEGRGRTSTKSLEHRLYKYREGVSARGGRRDLVWNTRDPAIRDAAYRLAGPGRYRVETVTAEDRQLVSVDRFDVDRHGRIVTAQRRRSGVAVWKLPPAAPIPDRPPVAPPGSDEFDEPAEEMPWHPRPTDLVGPPPNRGDTRAVLAWTGYVSDRVSRALAVAMRACSHAQPRLGRRARADLPVFEGFCAQVVGACHSIGPQTLQIMQTSPDGVGPALERLHAWAVDAMTRARAWQRWAEKGVARATTSQRVAPRHADRRRGHATDSSNGAARTPSRSRVQPADAEGDVPATEVTPPRAPAGRTVVARRLGEFMDDDEAADADPAGFDRNGGGAPPSAIAAKHGRAAREDGTADAHGDVEPADDLLRIPV